VLKIGLTGGIGSGKSTVSLMLKKKGFPIVDADIVAREVLETYPQILEQVKKHFGYNFFNENGKLKSSVVSASELETTVHFPIVIQNIVLLRK